MKTRRTREPKPPKLSGTQRALIAACADAGLPAPVPELHFHPRRRWRFDLAWPDERIAVEIDGGVFTRSHWRNGQLIPGGGAHNIGNGVKRDVEKRGEAFALGWRLLVIWPEDVENGRALAWLCRALLPESDARRVIVDVATAAAGGRATWRTR